MGKPMVVAAMSGGVDSAVAAGLLAEQGYEVVGVTMKMYEATRTGRAKSCCGSEDFDDARRSAAVLGIPHFVLDYTEEFQRGVIDRFVSAYQSGETPNPCVSCNTFVKLGSLRRYAAGIGAQFLATGHYARLEHGPDGPRLYRTPHQKDQAYALAGLRREQLAQLLLPLGNLQKEETRSTARRLGLPVHDKPESQDICFVEGGDYRDVIQQSGAFTTIPGELRNRDGVVVGLHTGIHNYTIGQRARLSGAAQASFVTHIDAETATVYLGSKDELIAPGLTARDLNLLQPNAFTSSTRTFVMLRSHARPAAATVTLDPDCKTLSLAFDEAQEAVTPGQLLVMLDATAHEVLGSATIDRRL